MKKTINRLCAAALFAVLATSARALDTQLGILDLLANGGINPATGNAWQDGDTYRFAFITSGTIDATSADIATYNSFVQNAAANSTGFANLGSVDWNAIVSTETVNAMANTSTNPGSNGPGEAIFLLDGSSIFAANYADLWDGANNSPTVRINRTENGDLRKNNYPDSPIWAQWTAVWTGTNNDGSTNNRYLGKVDSTSRHGLMQAEFNFWMTRSDADQATLLPIYALSEVLTIGGAALPGDTDGDGDIDDADLGASFANYTGPGGTGKTAAEGDTDGDGDVDDGDLGTSFAGYTGPLGPAVPEPTSLALIGLGGLMVARRRRA